NQPHSYVERSGFAGAVWPQQSNHFCLINVETDAIHYPAATIRFRDFVRCQGLHLLLARVLGLRLRLDEGGFSATYQHPTIVSKESQRIARNLASFGIKNARRMPL